ncbi:methyl-CpG-binding domain protein 2 isoform X1 [Poecilia formosa]|uniref:methyl-CpG-binding domain protein 2 isoform X1 n=1 Tax=Poecilia formosa TaxID=48698 RepID=UPI0007B7C711|nr:PREDICTED: methyl-CpG-binding domain protein 2 isoform X1 [Poecilia formosa]
MKDQLRSSCCVFILRQKPANLIPTTESDREEVPEQAAAGPLPRQRRGPGLLRLPDREDDARKTAEEQAAVPTRRTEPGQGRQTGPEHGSAHQTDGLHLQTARYQGYQSPRKQGEDGPAESRGAAATAVLGEASDGPAVVGHHRAGSAQHGPAQRPAGHRAGLRRRRPAVGHRQRPAHELGADHGSDVGGGREEPGHLAEHDPAALQDLHRDGRADPGSGAEGVPGPPQPGGGADGRRVGQSRRKLPGTAAWKNGLKTDRSSCPPSSGFPPSTKSRFKPGPLRPEPGLLPQVPQLRKPFIRLDPEQLRRIQTSNQSLQPAPASP